jgi:DNA-binding response OmpR family regulator
MDQYFPPSNDDQSAQVLVVDDELRIRSSLAQALRLSGYEVATAGSGEEALAQLESAGYDVMILDLRMPGLGGVDVLRRAHQLQPDLLIIVLTGHATLDSAIAAVKSEAADYLRKPVSVHNVIQTVNRVLQRRSELWHQQHLINALSRATEALRETETRRAALFPGADPSSKRLVHVYPLILDIKRQSVAIQGDGSGSVIELTKGETAVLASLMSHPGRVFTCRQLACQSLNYGVEETAANGVIRPIIFRLRRKLEINPRQPRLIRTVRGGGYYFAPSDA